MSVRPLSRPNASTRRVSCLIPKERSMVLAANFIIGLTRQEISAMRLRCNYALVYSVWYVKSREAGLEVWIIGHSKLI